MLIWLAHVHSERGYFARSLSSGLNDGAATLTPDFHNEDASAIASAHSVAISEHEMMNAKFSNMNTVS